ncbi:hypothetical protein BU17DRAFT_81883 [Hysterangium stoloniferum]|nr:hypothetical protein BU17DRAFT_81883 [Hysterangium stoloniferum]
MTEVDPKAPTQSAVDGPKQSEGNAEGEPPHPHFSPQGPSGQPFPPPNFAFYNYPPGHPPPPGDANAQDPNAPQANGEQMQYPPGMYPYLQVPPGYMPVSMAGMPIPGALIKPKRKQVKMACTNCAAACKRCDVTRPCERCIKYGLSESCHDGVRKERKKGFKRGPYNKRKRQEEREAHEWEAAQNNPNGEWTPAGNGAPFAGGPPPPGTFQPPPEGYYPAFYTIAPPHGPGPQLVPVPQPGAPGEQDGHHENNVDPNAQNAGDAHAHAHQPHGQPNFPPPHTQFVYPPLPPGTYPPFGYPFPGPPPQHPPPPPPQQPPQEDPVQSQSISKKKRTSDEGPKEDDDDEDPPTPPRKKRGRRTSDAEWPGTAKRSGKKGDGPTRRSTRRNQSQHNPDDDHGVEDGHVDAHVNATITDQDIVGQSEDPVIQSRA